MAVLATILVSTISPVIQQLQRMFTEAPRPAASPTHVAGICEPVQVTKLPATQNDGFALVAQDNGTQPAPDLPPNIGDLLPQACRENVAGFQKAYTVTFFAAIAAWILGQMLPGWPLRWAGRRAADAPAALH